MTCPACGQENRAGRKFCVECGGALALACAACGASYETGEKFCGECGAALATTPSRQPVTPDQQGSAPAATDADARKVVTIVFADLVGSTALHERLDAESAQRTMERYYEALRAVVDAHGGAVVKLLGDGVMAAFGLRQVAEDDALRAVRAGGAMQEAFRALRTEATALGAVGLRVAVNTGEVVVSGARDDVIGDPVNVAARLQEQGGDGDVVLGEATRRLVATRVTLAALGSVTLKGRAEAVSAYRLVSLDPPAGPTTTPFVGRDTELARLEAVYRRAVTTPATRLAVLLGSPGLGKSRLIDELTRRHTDGATILAAHCDAAGGATFAPLAQALRRFVGLDDGAVGETVRAAVEATLPAGAERERARIAAGIEGLLAGAPTSPEETFFVVRRFLAALAGAAPVVLVIDDLHWAEPLLLDLVEHLVQWGGGVPLFVLVGARPELRELRSSLVMSGGFVADVVTLDGLDAGAAMRLAANVIGAADLPAAVAAKVLATSEGNPLFVGELVRMLVEEGALTKEGERWTVGAGLASIEMPPTIHALLAARIERLRPEDRVVLERASVVGRHFSRSAVAALLGGNASELDARLESLQRSELIERDAGWLLGEPALRFHHVLIRDAAYRRLLKGTRAELHARLADWIEGRVGDAPEHDEIIGWHLEQAHQHLRELGPLDAVAIALGERASQHLAAAGRRALARDDLPLAAGLLGRAIERLDAAAAARADLALDWCEALLAAGDVGPATAAIAELTRFIDGPSQRLRAWHTCFTGQLTVLTAPEELQVTADAVAAAAAEFVTLGDAGGEAKAHQVHAQALARLGRVGASEAALDRALAAARRAGDRRRANAVLAGAPLAALWGPSPVTRASGRCLDVVRVLRITQGAPAVEAVALSCQGVLEALRGRIDAARRMIASARKMVEELGITHRLLEADVFAGRIDLLEGDAPAAERSLRSAYEGLRDLGLGIDAARAAALLARALLAQGKAAEAEASSRESEALAGDDLQASIAWRGVRAEALAQRGEHVAAIALAEAAVAIAAATDALLDHADARLALAAAFRAAGRSDEADAEKRRAVELWETKGATSIVERARREQGRASIPHAAVPRAEPTHSVQRRVRANAATASVTQFDAACASGAIAAIEATVIISAAVRVIDHPTESTYGRAGAVDFYRRLLRMKDAVVRHEPVASLGGSLGLFRRHISAGGPTGGRFDVVDYPREDFVLIEPGVVVEIFAADRLGDAVASLYGRYAELLPEGPVRSRATATARAIAAMVAPPDLDRYAAALAPSVEFEDHRTVGFSSGRGATKLLRGFRSLLELATEVATRVDDVVRLEPDGVLLRWTTSGIDRRAGGAFESPFLLLWTFGPDGLIAQDETFDAEREVEALARFDELARTGESAAPAAIRHVPPNTASILVARFQEAFAADDPAALGDLFASSLEVVDHPNGATYGRDGHLASVRRLRRGRDPKLRFEPIATLGEALCVSRRRITASGTGSQRFDVGEYDREEIVLFEVGERRCRHIEVFAADRLGDAIVRIYARYAELLAEDPAGDLAAATARSIAALTGFLDHDRVASAVAPGIEVVDRRILGTWSAHGADAWLRHVDSWLQIGDAHRGREDDVLGLRPDALLLRRTFSGTDRDGGGAFDGELIVLWGFGSDGRAVRWEMFDVDRESDALARFDALAADDGAPTAVSSTLPPANAAARALDLAVGRFHARDWAGFERMVDPEFRLDDRRRLVRLQAGAADFLAGHRVLFDLPDGRWRLELTATRGERLSLHRVWFAASGAHGGGSLAYDEHLSIVEVGADGRFVAFVIFDLEDLDAAYAELDAHYEADALTVGSARKRAVHRRVRPNAATAATAALEGAFARRDLAAIDALLGDPLETIEHPTGSTYGRKGQLESSRRMIRHPDLTFRLEPLATLGDAFVLARRTVTASGAPGGRFDVGEYEIESIVVNEVDEAGRLRSSEVFASDHLCQATARLYARYAQSLPEGPERTRAEGIARSHSVWDGPLDIDRVVSAAAASFVCVDHRSLRTWSAGGREEWLQHWREQADLATGFSRRDDDILAFAPDANVTRHTYSGTSRVSGGPFENVFLALNVFEAVGLYTRCEVFEPEREADALARFDEITDAHRRALVRPRVRANAAIRGIARFYAVLAAGDRAALAEVFDESLDVVHHPTRATYGRREMLGTWRSMMKAERLDFRSEVLASLGETLALERHFLSIEGLSEGHLAGFGLSEFDEIVLIETDALGRWIHVEIFAADHFAEAIIRLYQRHAELLPEGPARAHAAGTARAVATHYHGATDPDRFAAALAPGIVAVDHRIVGFGTLHGRDAVIAAVRALLELSDGVTWRADDVLALSGHASLIRATQGGRARASGGEWERSICSLFVHDTDGLIARWEIFEAEQEPSALACYDELVRSQR